MHTAGLEAAPGPLFDPERAAVPAEPELSMRPAPRQRGMSLGLLLSLALHLAPLLLFLSWHRTPVEAPAPIPVALVIEQPPPQPIAPPRPEVKPPRGRLASEEVGAKADRSSDAPAEPSAETQPPAAPPRATPPQDEKAQDEKPQAKPNPRAAPQPELRQVANLVALQREPMLLDQQALALPAPSVEPLPDRPVEPAPRRKEAPQPRPPQHAAAVEGPPAARDEYLARLVTLVRPYLRLLPPEMLRGRHGTTNLAILILGDGTIARITVAQSSGYPDIDARVMQMIAAVGRFPPLPPWIDQPSWQVDFHLRFPFPTGGG